MSKEQCQRCCETDYDRRTLLMACFYDMGELELPFKDIELLMIKQKDVKETAKEETMLVDGEPFPYTNTQRTAIADAPVTTRRFHTLRVCKDCRADWMAAIKMWFSEFPKVKTSCGSGIFVRENGITVEITEEEWNKRYPGKVPVRIIP